MVRSAIVATSLALFSLGHSQCPFADANRLGTIAQGESNRGSRDHVARFELDDGDAYLTTDVGGRMQDDNSLKAGESGPTLLEDFIFRQKMTHFDHERVPERVVHARGTGAYGTFTSYADFSNITAASFLGEKGKQTPMFVRFSTVVGSRGSGDTVRDVHGFAARFYTDEGNFDIVGNNIPVFFIQDAIKFPDLVHSVKPSPDNEIPQASVSHESAWDFFSQETSSLHTVMWAMAGYGVPRSFRHMDGFGVHTFRMVTDDGDSKFIKWHWKTKQGKASLTWDEAQHIAGKNPDFHRQDLWDAIRSGNYPEWELNIQIIDEDKAQAFGFDVLDPTKIIPEEHAPLHPLGIMRLDANPTNFFAETEQIMFQPAHIVRGIDFTEDPLLQGRIFSYLDTQINRHGGPNFEQIPINRPISPVHNNNRDGAAQNFIHTNKAPYTPNTLNKGFPKQASQTEGRGFFTAPNRKVSGSLSRSRSSTFSDHWSQPRLFYNSLQPIEQQFVINAIRFEISKQQKSIQENVIKQLNKISHDIAERVARVLGLQAPSEDSKYYHDNTTTGITIFGNKLPTIATLKVGVLASVESKKSLDQAKAIKEGLKSSKVTVTVIGEALTDGVDLVYVSADAVAFDGIVVADGTESLFNRKTQSAYYPLSRPATILEDGYNWGKPIGFLGNAKDIMEASNVAKGPGVYEVKNVDELVRHLQEGLAVFKFTDRFPMDE